MSTVLMPRTATVLLFQGDDLAKIAELRKAAEAEQSDTRLMGELSAAQEHDEFVKEAEARAVRVVLKALGRKQWRNLVADHPPRKGVESDKALGVNDETFGDALVLASLEEPEFASTGDAEEFLDSLRSADFDQLYHAAFALNRFQADAPKADLTSRLTRTSDET